MNKNPSDVTQTISNSEWEIMRIIWTIGDTYSNQIIKELQVKKNWSESTIKTLIRRLIKKRFLKAKKEHHRFIYTAAVKQTDMIYKSSQQFLEQICDMHKGQVILKLLADSPISKIDLAKMKKLINKKMQTSPAKIPCNCLTKGDNLC